MKYVEMEVANVNIREKYNTVDFWGWERNPDKDIFSGGTAEALGCGTMDPSVHNHPNSSNPPGTTDWREYSAMKSKYDVMANKTQVWFYNKKMQFLFQ